MYSLRKIAPNEQRQNEMQIKRKKQQEEEKNQCVGHKNNFNINR